MNLLCCQWDDNACWAAVEIPEDGEACCAPEQCNDSNQLQPCTLDSGEAGLCITEPGTWGGSGHFCGTTGAYVGMLDSLVCSIESGKYFMIWYPSSDPNHELQWPLISFNHALGVYPWNYEDYLQSVADQGFVIIAVVGCDGMSLVEVMADLEVDQITLVEYMQDENNMEYAWVDHSKPAGIWGHSAGAGATYANAEKGQDMADLNVVAAYAQANGDMNSRGGAQIPTMFNSGTDDHLIPAKIVEQGYTNSKDSKVYALYTGIQHFECVEYIQPTCVLAPGVINWFTCHLYSSQESCDYFKASTFVNDAAESDEVNDSEFCTTQEVDKCVQKGFGDEDAQKKRVSYGPGASCDASAARAGDTSWPYVWKPPTDDNLQLWYECQTYDDAMKLKQDDPLIKNHELLAGSAKDNNAALTFLTCDPIYVYSRLYKDIGQSTFRSMSFSSRKTLFNDGSSETRESRTFGF